MKKGLIAIILFLSFSDAFAQRSLLEGDEAFTSLEFRRRVRQATRNFVHAGNYPSDTSRIFAEYIISKADYTDWLGSMTSGATANPVINEQSPDNDIQFQVNTVFDDVARIFIKELNK